MPVKAARRKRFAEIASRYWSPSDPPNPLPRYCVRVSYEDSSDVSDYFVFHDDFAEAEQEYDGYSIWDLDSRDWWNIECSQRAVPVTEHVCWHVGATVFPDGSVERWESQGLATADVAVDAHLNEQDDAWDGHTQGHCGFHISIHGSDKKAALTARQRAIKRYKPLCNGTCSCGLTENYIRDFGDEEEVDVVFVGGPDDGRVQREKRHKESPPKPGLPRFAFEDASWIVGFDGGNYGSRERDGDRYVRR